MCHEAGLSESIQNCSVGFANDRKNCEQTSNCFWCKNNSIEGCYENVPTTTTTTTTTTTAEFCSLKIGCNREPSSCKDNNCQVNHECYEDLNHEPCFTSNNENEHAGRCPSESAEDTYNCGIFSTKTSCVKYDPHCAWCEKNGQFECVTDDVYINDGKCPNSFHYQCKTGNFNDKTECINQNCAWCDG